MSRSALALLPVVLALSPQIAPAQEHYTLGPVSRIILVDIKRARVRSSGPTCGKTFVPYTTSTSGKG
jgi:hypothetical protein